MKNLSILFITCVLLSCSTINMLREPNKIHETKLTIFNRLDKAYYDSLLFCLKNPPINRIDFINACLKANCNTETPPRISPDYLVIDTIIHLSYQENSSTIHTELLVNEKNSVHLDVDYVNCIGCPITVSSFSLYYKYGSKRDVIIRGEKKD
ncbi:MAG: hypothetical protein ACJA0Q_000594 [Saprospiraceae bacterium]|jgi:hypothetical protein